MAKPEKHVFVCVQARPPPGHPCGSCSARGGAAIVEEHLLNSAPVARLAVSESAWG